MRRDFSSVLSEPLCLLLVEVWCQSLEYLLVVVVQKLLVLACHDIRIDSIEVHWDKCDSIEVHELSVLVELTLAAEKLVLKTDTMRSCYVNSRLVIDYHSLVENLSLTLSVLPSEACRTRVDVEEISYAVACTVVEVEVAIPEWLS